MSPDFMWRFWLMSFQSRSLKSKAGSAISLVVFFCLRRLKQKQNKTKPKKSKIMQNQASLASSCSITSSVISWLVPEERHWLIIFFQRSLIDFFVKSVHSGHIWETQLCNKLNFYLRIFSFGDYGELFQQNIVKLLKFPQLIRRKSDSPWI